MLPGAFLFVFASLLFICTSLDPADPAVRYNNSRPAHIDRTKRKVRPVTALACRRAGDLHACSGGHGRSQSLRDRRCPGTACDHRPAVLLLPGPGGGSLQALQCVQQVRRQLRPPLQVDEQLRGLPNVRGGVTRRRLVLHASTNHVRSPLGTFAPGTRCFSRASQRAPLAPSSLAYSALSCLQGTKAS